MQFSDGYGDFPPAHEADDNGIIAIGATLAPDRLIHAYQHGIFPWYNEGEPIFWHCPPERCVFLPEHFHVSKSFRKFLKITNYTVTHNKNFRAVIQHCAEIPRKGQDGTWIHQEMIEAYIDLHEKGWAESYEVWENNELIGGIYGIRLKNIFFGESMFSLKTNASKFALHHILFSEKLDMIDAQVENKHLMSLGAVLISREKFMAKINI